MTFKTVTEFSSYDDASGAQMTMFHPLCGNVGFSFVNGKINRYGDPRVKCFGNRAIAKRKWAADKLQAEFQTKVDALGPEWMARHRELYEIA
jgi:hypothetical protein